jgi:ribonuclease P protein subunit RPR2
MPKRRHKGHERRIAFERMSTLLSLAEREALARRGDRARRYVVLARRIGMRYNVRMPRKFKRSFCKACNAYLVPSMNAKVRVRAGRVAVTCTACGAIQRFPYGREQAERRKGRRIRGPEPAEATVD